MKTGKVWRKRFVVKNQLLVALCTLENETFGICEQIVLVQAWARLEVENKTPSFIFFG